MWVLIALTVTLVVAIHWLLTSSYGYWKKRGVPFPTPKPLVGNVGQTVILSRSFGQISQDIYNDYKDCLYVGIYRIRQPTLLLRDLDLIKDIAVKDFSSFHDNDINVDEKLDPLFARNPFSLRGQKWKIVRSQVTTNMTSGKIKNMFYIITNVGKHLISYLETEVEATGKDGLDAKELSAKFTTDAVAACAFGLEAKSFVDPNAEFRQMGRKILAPSFWMGIKHMIIFLFPSLACFLQIRFVPTEVHDWLTGTLKGTMEFRKKNNIVRNDYLDTLIGLKSKPGEYEFTDLDVTAQAMTFYIDGFETSSIALSYTLYELAANPHVQTKLREEVDAMLSKNNGEITYDAIHEMTYLDNVLSESLRKYPPGTALGKLCTKPYTFPPSRGEGTGPSLEIEVGTPIIIPIYAIHHDPQYYPEPDKFDPERFTEENKKSRPKYSYLPFGEGPRQCLGARFALTQTKVALVSIISKFDLKVNPKTRTPLEIDPAYFILAPKGGLWLNFYKRSN